MCACVVVQRVGVKEEKSYSLLGDLGNSNVSPSASFKSLKRLQLFLGKIFPKVRRKSYSWIQREDFGEMAFDYEITSLTTFDNWEFVAKALGGWVSGPSEFLDDLYSGDKICVLIRVYKSK